MATLIRSFDHGAWGWPQPIEGLAAVADLLHEGLQVLDPEFRYLYVNDIAARQHSGRSKEAMLGRRVAEVFEGIQDTRLYAELNRCMHERTRSRLETRFRFPDGTARWFALRVEPIPQGLAVLSLDVDEQKRLEQEMLRARTHQAAGREAGGMVHDLNNLLTVILAACDLLELEPLPRASQRDEVAQIRAASERGAELMARLRRTVREERLRRVEVNDALRELVPMLRTLVGPRRHLEVDLAPDVGAVRMDPAELDRVVINLVTNARDALQPGGHVALSTAWVDGEVRIRVADDGCGMDAATRDRIFEGFFSTKEADGGTGLGLPTSRDIVTRAGGRITVDSRLHEGSEFDVWLPPLLEPPAPSTRPRAGEDDDAALPRALPDRSIPES